MKKVGLVAAMMLAALPGGAQAQAWIGTMVGNMMAQEREAQREAACRAGAPADEKAVDWATTSSEAALAGYQELDRKSDEGKLRKVFAMNKDDVRWKGPDGAVPILDLPKQLGADHPVLTRQAFVVAGDGTTARGVWLASWPADPTRKAWYAIDFVGGPHTMWGGGKFHIWHMTVFTGDKQPDAPAAYCHYDRDQAW